MTKNSLIIIINLIFLISCEKEEKAINVIGCSDPIASNYNQFANVSNNSSCNYESYSTTIPLLSNYQNQIFFNIKNNSFVSENLKSEWDLGFETGNEGFHITINSSTFSQISSVSNISFEDITSVNNLNWQWDNPSGNIDSTAIGDYRITPERVWVLDRGLTSNGSSRGFKKFLIENVNEEYYSIRYANLDNTKDTTVNIYKNNNYHFTQFSFNTNSQIQIEPEINSWDLLFSQYTHLYKNNIEVPAYLVTGVLINHLSNVQVAVDSSLNYEEITLDDANIFTNFSNKKNIIGYNWKDFNFDTQTYTVKTYITYVIRNNSNEYYKMRFIDFYNEVGEKGFPKIEIQKL
tara:strand:- start:9 stop:1052 length:1044 start_codon:yes stop_codon:yes gene_type:complete